MESTNQGAGVMADAPRAKTKRGRKTILVAPLRRYIDALKAAMKAHDDAFAAWHASPLDAADWNALHDAYKKTRDDENKARRDLAFAVLLATGEAK